MAKIGKVVIVEKVKDNSDKIVSGVITAAGAFLVFKGIRKLLKNKKCEIVEKAPEELQEEFEKFKEKKENQKGYRKDSNRNCSSSNRNYNIYSL